MTDVLQVLLGQFGIIMLIALGMLMFQMRKR